MNFVQYLRSLKVHFTKIKFEKSTHGLEEDIAQLWSGDRHPSLTPLIHPTKPNEIARNSAHLKTRNIIESCFGSGNDSCFQNKISLFPVSFLIELF